MAHHKKHHKKGAAHHHTAEQHRGENMHLHSHPGHDELAHKSKKLHHQAKHDSSAHAPTHEHAGDMSIAHGYNPPETYQMGKGGGELGANEHYC